MWDAARFQERLQNELAAAPNAAEVERLLQQHATLLQRLLTEQQKRPAIPNDERFLAAVLDSIDLLRTQHHVLTQRDPERFWLLWPLLLTLYSTVAQRLSNHGRFRLHLAVAFARMGWLLQQAFDWFWHRTETAPEVLWNALYRLYTAASERRVVWKRIADPLMPDGKTSTHERVAAVLGTYIVDPARTPPPRLTPLRQLIETHAGYLQIVPQNWLAPEDDTPRYGFSLHTWAPPRLNDNPAAHDLWLLDFEALLSQLQQPNAPPSATVSPEETEMRTVLRHLLAQPPKARSQTRELAALEPTRLIHGWDAIYAAIAGRPFEYRAAAVRSPYLKSQRIALFADGHLPPSDAEQNENDPWRLWDKSPDGWQLVRRHTPDRTETDPLVPQQLVAVQPPSTQAEPKPWVLARVRWRAVRDHLLRIGVQRFSYDRLVPVPARPLNPVGAPPLPWSFAFLLIRSRDALDPWETLIVPVRDKMLPKQWELSLNQEERMILVEERLETGVDYCWFSFRSL